MTRPPIERVLIRQIPEPCDESAPLEQSLGLNSRDEESRIMQWRVAEGPGVAASACMDTQEGSSPRWITGESIPHHETGIGWPPLLAPRRPRYQTYYVRVSAQMKVVEYCASFPRPPRAGEVLEIVPPTRDSERSFRSSLRSEARDIQPVNWAHVNVSRNLRRIDGQNRATEDAAAGLPLFLYSGLSLEPPPSPRVYPFSSISPSPVLAAPTSISSFAPRATQTHFNSSLLKPCAPKLPGPTSLLPTRNISAWQAPPAHEATQRAACTSISSAARRLSKRARSFDTLCSSHRRRGTSFSTELREYFEGGKTGTHVQ
ncbi:hypothetical protein FB451DRAFT_1174866 [Mycena latifolia]|nr:hypothetical protein FB451DRAFT_1174866 [Mycena latifolia]